MTKDNSKKLYDYYVKIGYEKAAKDMALKYPEFVEKKESSKKK